MDDHFEPLQLNISVACLPCQVRNFPNIKNTTESFLIDRYFIRNSSDTQPNKDIGFGVLLLVDTDVYKTNKEYLSIMQQMIVG